MGKDDRVKLSYAPPPDQGGAGWAAVLLAAGVASGLLCVLLAFAMAGAGHGWCSPILISWVAVFAAPLAGRAWAYRKRPNVFSFALVLIVTAIIADLALLLLSGFEGTEYFNRTCVAMPVVVMAWAALWAALWAAWQAAAAATLFFSAL